VNCGSGSGVAVSDLDPNQVSEMNFCTKQKSLPVWLFNIFNILDDKIRFLLKIRVKKLRRAFELGKS
jgi:hypothetical protein